MQKISRFSPVPVRTGIFPRRSVGQIGTDARFLTKILRLFTTLSISFCLAFGALLVQRSENPTLEPVLTNVRLFLASALSPVIRFTEKPVHLVKSWTTSLTMQQNVLEENRSLQLQNQYLQRQQNHLQQLAMENQQLREALKLESAHEMFYGAAKVTGHSYNGACSHLIVSSQASETLKKNSPVLSVEGCLVGRVVSSSEQNARVMPINSINSRVPVQMEDTREHAILMGDQDHGLKLTHLEKAAPVKIGTKLVTSGVGGVFPAGIPVAVVTAVEGETIKATPFADTKRIDYVVVLQ